MFGCCWLCHRLHHELVNTEIGPGVLRCFEEQVEGIHGGGQLYDGVDDVPGEDGGDGLVARECVSGRLVGGGRLATKLTVLCPNSTINNVQVALSTLATFPSIHNNFKPSLNKTC